MKMDYRSIAAIALCVLFYLGYTHYLNTKYPKPVSTGAETSSTPGSNATTTATTTSATPATSAAPGTPAAPEVKPLSKDDLTLETDMVVYHFEQNIGGLSSVTLKKYTANKVEKTDPDTPMELLDGPLAVQGVTDVETTSLPLAMGFRGERVGRTIRFTRDANDLRIAQEYTVPEQGYGSTVKVTFTNTSAKAIDLTAGILARETIRPKVKSHILGIIPGTVIQRDQAIYNADGSTEWKELEKFCKDDESAKANGVPIKFFGIDRHYFLSILEPKAKTGNLRISHAPNNDAGCPVTIISYDKQGLLQPGETTALDYSAYFGPKDLQTMKDHNADLESAMHLGTFGFIGRPLLLVIQGFEKVVGNFGVAIILLTLCLKLLFYPLVRASSTSMHRMKKLNPEMQAIRDKFKEDKPRQQQEIMKFMVANKINPMKGCLPILPQIPVFFAFYQVLQTSIQLRHAPFYGWIQDLSAMDPFFVTPLLMGVAMFVQQKLTPTTGMDKTQEKILMFMPVMFTVMMLTLPAGLTLYMLTNTCTGIAQQKWLYRRLDKLGAK